jgi:hypothetical protein
MLLASLTLLQLLLWLSLLPITAAPVLAAVRWRHLGRVQRYLAVLVWFELPLELLGFALAFAKRNNLFIMPFYTVGELCLLALVYREALQSATFSRWMPWVAGAFVAYAATDSLLLSNLHWHQPGQQVVQGLLILLMVGLYLRKLLHELRVQNLWRDPMLWVSVGLLLYFVGYLQIAWFSNYLLQHYSMAFNQRIWTVHAAVANVLHGCYCVALALPAVAAITAQPASREAVYQQ